MKKCLLFLIFSFSLSATFAQTTLFFQGFENAALNCAENWGYTGGTRSNLTNRTGSFSGLVGNNGASNTLTFNTVSVSGLSGLNLQIFHSVRSGSGPGMDSREGAEVLVSLNGAPYSIIGQVSGNGDHNYTFSSATGGILNTCGQNFTMPNPFIYSIPVGTNTISIRVITVGRNSASCASSAFLNDMTSMTASNFDRADEGFFIDDIRLTTTSTLNPGLWTGTVSTDWFNCINWQDKIVPTALTPVTINQTALRNCQIAAAGAAVCQSLSMASNNAITNNLSIVGASSLTVGGNVTMSKTAGTGVVNLELLGASTLSCQSLSLTGTAAAAQNAELKIEDVSSIVNISGNFTNNLGGTLDMSTGGPATGTLNLSGVWIGNGSETDFRQTGSNVNLIGAGLQTINTNNYTEVFHNLTINKTANPVLLFDDIEIDATGILNLTNDQLALNSRTVTVQNPAANAIQQSGLGSIVGETTDNLSRVRWNIGTSAGAHIFPFARGLNGVYIPFSFTVTSGNAGIVTLATYGTGADNLPWPSGPVDVVNNLNSVIGLSPDNRDATVDRFWQIDVTGTPTATLGFSYAAIELPAAPYNDPFSIMAQRYETSTDVWEAPLPGQAAAVQAVTVPGVTTFSPWTLSSINSLLPVEVLKFEAEAIGSTAQLDWATATETNNDYFLVEHSNDGINFETIGQVKGAGTYEGRSDYQFVDETPNNGINYYRLKMVDFDGSFSYSEIAAVSFDKNYNLTIFPNPLSGNHVLNISSSEKIEKIRIINTLGQELFLLEQPTSQFNLPSFWAAGFYTVLLETSDATLMRKLIIE